MSFTQTGLLQWVGNWSKSSSWLKDPQTSCFPPFPHSVHLFKSDCFSESSSEPWVRKAGRSTAGSSLAPGPDPAPHATGRLRGQERAGRCVWSLAGGHSSLGQGTSHPSRAPELREGSTSQGCGRETSWGDPVTTARGGDPPSTALGRGAGPLCHLPEMGSEKLAVKGCLA